MSKTFLQTSLGILLGWMLLSTSAVAQNAAKKVTKDSRPPVEAPAKPDRFRANIKHFNPILSVSSNIKTRNQMKKVPGTGEVAIYGSLIYSGDWSEPAYGLYRFSADATTPVALDSLLYAVGGGVCIDDKYEFVYRENQANTYYIYDLAREEFTTSIPKDDDSCLGLDVTYDPVDKKVYGCFYNSSQTGYLFGTRDRATGTTTKIADMSSPFVAIAANKAGTLYAIDNQGQFGTVDKSTGQLTVIGSTGVTPRYLQSATFDDQDRFIWAASLDDGTAGIYEVALETGAATCLWSFDYGDEIVGAYVPVSTADPKAPAAVENLSVNFEKDELSGSVGFRMPTTTLSGEQLSGSLTAYLVYGTDTLTQSAGAGDSVTFTLNLTASGKYLFEAFAGNNEGKGPKVWKNVFVGPDVPAAVTDLMATEIAPNKIYLSWINATVGKNGGYFNPDDYSVGVVRQPDNVLLTSHYQGDNWTDSITSSQLTNYYYEVTTYAGEEKGATATTSKLAIGSYITPPFLYDFDEKSDLDFFKIIDNNYDYTTWDWIPDSLMMGCPSGTYAFGDDWLITPPVRLSADCQYILSYDVGSCGLSDIQNYELRMGTSAEIEAMTDTLVAPNDVCTPGDQHNHIVLKVHVPADSVYYFGFHFLSRTYMKTFKLDNIEMSAPENLSAPAATANLKAQNDINGSLKADLSCTAPASTISGESLTGALSAKIARNGQLIKTISDVSPSAELQYTDNEAEEGVNVYSVTFANDYGDGEEAADTTYCGLDVPAKIDSVIMTVSDGKVDLSWTPVAVGKHNGFIGNDITYSVYNGLSQQYVAEDITSTTFEGDPIPEIDGQKPLYYLVFASNSKGKGDNCRSNVYIAGDAYELPFKETFAHGQLDYSCWITTESNGNNASWATTGEFGEDDAGCAYFFAVVPENSCRMSSGKIDISHAKHPVVTFSSYTYGDDEMVLEVSPTPYVTDFQPVATYVHTDELGFGRSYVPLEDFKSAGQVMLGFHAYSHTGNVLYLDNVELRDVPDYDLTVRELNVPEKMKLNEKTELSATIMNNGFLDSGDFTVELLRDGKLISSVEATSLVRNDSVTMTFSDSLDIIKSDSVKYEIRVLSDLDTNLSDNSMIATATVNRPILPVVTDLSGSVNGLDVTLTWSQPNLEGGEIYSTTDDFESYDAFTISNLGRWSMIDGDGSDTYAIYSYTNYDNVFEPMAFQVYNPYKLDMDFEWYPSWKPASGEQYLVCWSSTTPPNDDWLITPQLSGNAQTISMKVKAPQPTYGAEEYYLLYSTTDTDTASFMVIGDLHEASNETDWEEVSFNVPEGAKYAAVHCVSSDKFALAIDDVSFETVTAAFPGYIIGYNVYVDGVLMNSEPLPTPGTTLQLEEGDHVVTVTVVYNYGESGSSNEYIISVDAISQMETYDASQSPMYDVSGRRVITPRQGQIVIKNGKKTVTK
ncbi:MAG: choice-of-anchor J domain-containing protein [Prevotella sp.]|jgi:hypothetical protein